MFTVQQRQSLQDRLIAAASADASVCGAALLGSAARSAEDRWSDIDLALRLRPGVDPQEIADAYSKRLRQDQEVVDHLDMWADGGLYRVFLLGSTLQLDLSLWPYDSFRATGPAFRLLFGEAMPPTEPAVTDPGGLVRLAWLHALHARSAIARSRAWQSVWMLEGMRNQIVALACVRHGLNPHQGRGVDLLPVEIRGTLNRTLVFSTDRPALRQVLSALTDLLLQEAAFVTSAHTSQLETTLRRLIATVPD